MSDDNKPVMGVVKPARGLPLVMPGSEEHQLRLGLHAEIKRLREFVEHVIDTMPNDSTIVAEARAALSGDP